MKKETGKNTFTALYVVGLICGFMLGVVFTMLTPLRCEKVYEPKFEAILYNYGYDAKNDTTIIVSSDMYSKRFKYYKISFK